MRQAVEIIINIFFWLFTIFMIATTFNFGIEEIDLELVDGKEIISEFYNADSGVFLYTSRVLNVVMFYLIAFFFVPRYFKPGKRAMFTVLMVLCCAAFFVLEIVMAHFTTASALSVIQFTSLGILGFYATTALTYGIIRAQSKEEKQKQLRANENLRAELKLLRSQINPHFLFNALNNLMAVAEREQNSEVAAGIGQLSDLLRYLIYNTQNDTVLLSKEVEFIEAYIALNELRFAAEDDIEISLNIEGSTQGVKVAPATLIPLVENAFKHGISLTKKSFIKMTLKVNDDTLGFNISNSTNSEQKTELEREYGGVGLENLRKRLAFIYPDKHEFGVTESESEFAAKLILQLT